MVGGLIPNDADDWHSRTLGVVEVSQPIGETGSTMQQGCCRFPSYSRITIRRSSHYSLEKPKHTTNARNPVERSNKMHLTCARVSKAGFNTTLYQGEHKTLSTAHALATIGGPVSD
jgi:hypothetical protein